MAEDPLQLIVAGVINTLWLTLEMLDEKGVLSREESHAWLADCLQKSKLTGASALPLAQLVGSLGKPRGQRSGWIPTVHEGGPPKDP